MSPGSIAGSRPRNIALVVVHGVGETDPGYCVGNLFESLEKNATGYEVDKHSISERLADPDAEGIQDQEERTASFPVNLRKATHASGMNLVGLELYWADTTMIQPGRLNTIMGLARTIFESQHLVHAMLNRKGHFASAFVRNLLLLAAWLLRGPIAAITIVTSALCAVLMFEPEWFHYNVPSMRWHFVATLAALIALTLYFLNRIKKKKDYIWYDAILLTGMLSVALLALDQLGLLFPLLEFFRTLYNYNPFFPDRQPGLPFNCALEAELPACYVSGLYRVIIVLWKVWGAIVIAGACAYLVVLFEARKDKSNTAVAAISTSVGILVLQFLLWVTIVVSLLYPMLLRAESHMTVNKQVQAYTQMLSGRLIQQPVGEPEAAKLVSEFTVADSAPGVRQLTGILGLSDIKPDWIERFKFIYLSAAITLLLLLARVVWLMVERKKRAAAGLENLAPDEEPPQEQLEANAAAMPRLLFHSSLIWTLVLALLIVFTLVNFQHILYEWPWFLTLRGVLLGVTALVAAAVSYLIGPRITNVVHIARDLIDHHFRPKYESTPQLRPALRYVDDVYSRRIRIRKRLKSILEKHVRHGGFDEVYFIAHSQGSVIAYDYLRYAAPDFPEIGHARPALLTFGSPIGTLYQEYFCEYERDQLINADLRRSLQNWVNMYRVDDYIGGPIAGPPEFPIENIVMKSGKHRHTEYWKEDRVARALDRMINPPPVPVELVIRETVNAPRTMPALV